MIVCRKKYTRKESESESGMRIQALERLEKLTNVMKHMEYVSDKMTEIEHDDELSIHEMADLERYANTLRLLSEAYSFLVETIDK